MDVAIAGDGASPSHPSVLGQDVLAQWVMVHDPRGGLLEFEMFDADIVLPPPSG